MSPNVNELSTPLTILSILNGMIGGSILVIPVAAGQAGIIPTCFIIIGTAIFSFYSCFISLEHMGDQKDLDNALLRHFNGSKFIKIFYDVCVCSGFVLVEILYFQLITIQWIGLLPPYQFTYLNVGINGVILLFLCFLMKYFDFGAHLMGYGIISIIFYLFFLVWVVSSAPSGDNSIPLVGSGIGNYAAMMGNAFSIQGYFIPVLKKNKNKSRYVFYVFLSYVIGAIAYYYIAFMGAFGILNRKLVIEGDQTVEGYFDTSDWQVKLLQGIYLLHLYTVFPEYLLVSKKRLFSIFNFEESIKGKIFWSQAIYIVIFISVCLIITCFQVNIDVVIDINGAVLGFAFVYFLPTIMHIRCIYCSKGKIKLVQSEDALNINTQQQQQSSISQKEKQKIEIQLGLSQRQSLTQKLRQKTIISIKNGKQAESQSQLNPLKEDYSCYYCAAEKPPLWKQVIMMTALAIMFLVGLGIMVNGLYAVVQTIEGKT